MIGHAKGVSFSRFDIHRSVNRTVRIVAVAALDAIIVHHTFEKRIPLNTIFVGGAVVPKFG